MTTTELAPSGGRNEKTRGWRSVPEVGTVLGIRIVAVLCRLFGRRVASALLWFLSVYYALFAGSARRASKSYLARVGEKATLRAVIRHFFYFARVSLDRYLFLGGRINEFDFHCYGEEHVHRAARRAVNPSAADAPPRGAILLGAHIGSFEAMRAVSERDNAPVNVIADFRTTQRMNGVLARLAPQLNFRLIALDPTRATSMLDVKERIDRGELVAILGDRVPDRSDRSVEADFLGGKALFPTGPFLLAHMLSCPVYLVFGLFLEPNRYEVYCEPFADVVKLPRATRAEALKTYAQKYAERLEVYVKKAPYNWFNFFEFWQ